MNIFALSYCPVESAQWQHDKHVVKMLLETAQMLSTNARLVPEWLQDCDNAGITDKLYASAYVNHPCTKWARQSLGNFRWLVMHGRALWREYDYRFGGLHKSYSQVIEPLYHVSFDDMTYGGEDMTPFATAMPDSYKIAGNSVQSYRDYYTSEKILPDSRWTGRCTVSDLPRWMSEKII